MKRKFGNKTIFMMNNEMKSFWKETECSIYCNVRSGNLLEFIGKKT